MRLPKDIEKFIKSLSWGMYALRDNKDNEDPAERVSIDMFLTNLQEDHSEMYTELKLYPEWSDNTVIGIDLNLNWDGKLIPMRFITQNPGKRSSKDPKVLSDFAILDREGHAVVWVMRRMSNGDTKFLGHTLDGEYIKNGEKEAADTESVVNDIRSFNDLITELTVTLPHVSNTNIEAVVTKIAEMGALNETAG